MSITNFFHLRALPIRGGPHRQTDASITTRLSAAHALKRWVTSQAPCHSPLSVLRTFTRIFPRPCVAAVASCSASRQATPFSASKSLKLTDRDPASPLCCHPGSRFRAFPFLEDVRLSYGVVSVFEIPFDPSMWSANAPFFRAASLVWCSEKIPLGRARLHPL